MKRLFLSAVMVSNFTLFTNTSFAQSCNSLDKQASQQSVRYQPRLSMQVIGQKGYRSHFYAAPSEQCKLKQLFLIPKDSVIAYEEIKSDGQTWVSVMYVRNDGETVQGWMKNKDLKVTGKIGF